MSYEPMTTIGGPAEDIDDLADTVRRTLDGIPTTTTTAMVATPAYRTVTIPVTLDYGLIRDILVYYHGVGQVEALDLQTIEQTVQAHLVDSASAKAAFTSQEVFDTLASVLGLTAPPVTPSAATVFDQITE